jgi:ElaB/YqjD/DUF883 family membrane-anchored ribosome-binding protein
MIPNPEVANATRRGTVENVGELPTTEKLQSMWLKGKERVIEGEKRFEHYVAEHPVKSVLIAAGAGLALGWLLTRKR